MTTIYATELQKGLSEERFALYLSQLPPERQKKVNGFLRREDSLRALLAQILLRIIILRTLPLKNTELNFDFNRYGKPALRDYPAFHFNLSHSGDWVVLAINNAPVGVDVERIKQMDMDIAKRFFSPREYQDLLAQPAGRQLEYFFDLWTLKESYIKALGKGLSQPLDSFSMVFKPGGVISLITEDDANWFFRQYPFAPGYKLAVCATADTFPEAVIFKTPDELYHEFVELQDKWSLP